ncbi:Uncharacterised protein [Serratia fonticola]|uniref:Uncharacterized protein n=1 Tax=Serratia fonticola TaxID=47917 RepID=A0A4U9WMU6_SERFO|nr:Uncharacterised protein [Serratia fonticola]
MRAGKLIAPEPAWRVQMPNCKPRSMPLPVAPNAAMAEVASQITQLQDDDQQLASKLDVVIAKAEGNTAQIAQEKAARVDADGALAKDIRLGESHGG